MLTALRGFLNDPRPARAEALHVLRGVFATMFLGQAGAAVVLAGALALLTDGRAPASTLTSQVLIFLALADLPVAATLALFTNRTGGKGAALAAAILAGVLLATPTWFLAFAALIGSANVYLVALLVVVLNAYAVGFLLCGRFAATATLPPRTGAAETAAKEAGEESEENAPTNSAEALAEQAERQVETH